VSKSEDGPFARWSLRKQAVRRAENRTPDEATHAAGAKADAADADQQFTEEGAPFAEPAEPLPSLEDLTAEADLSAFLRDGVPTALKNAAIRKMWALDPAIRDHVGLAEYAWDFNKPGAMPGFGPLEAGKAVVDFLSTGGSETPAGPEEAAPAPDAPDAASEPGASLPSNEPVQSPGGKEDLPRSATETGAIASAEATETADASRTPPRRRHGGALPR
jgi:Protein of unknown function (DUF3306)